MSQQSAASKPSLQGVRIKARKRAVKASAKHEPSVFRDQLYKHLETVPEGDFDGFANKLVQAGSTLEYQKYADALFEILLVGGLLQPGGSYVEDGAPPSPFSIFKAKEPVEVADIKKYVEVFNKLIRRYKYLQRPLETSSLPNLLQYVNRWSPVQQQKLMIATGLILAQGLAAPSCLQSLTKDHLVKNDVSASAITNIFRAYLTEQSMDHLSSSLKKGGVRDLLAFFPPQKRDDKTLDEHFRKEGLPQIADWWTKKQYAVLKDEIMKGIKDMLDREEPNEEVIGFIKSKQAKRALPETELISCIWQGITSSIDWAARPDQIEGLAVREIGRYAPILEPFCNGPKVEVALINTVQVHSYEDTRIIKAFPQILKVLYNKDCISDQAIIYWHQKGSKPQGRQHFLTATEALVKYLQEQESEEEDDE
ncbi:ARM repeat-containing protein [Gloeophyllum trabeum ATCC 11539]|uniref:ARM repeat-containing protein n=1 Tax=Gloeophyllum trabeum (strain ATCC 11539 / FP-39264 / Madison 617) TaxID=670483 RepID=S7QCC9_GLOTA|nr:ARM repeat-containing protein [Gloeophyllum trabeum ATCC 11539]EPQ57028.1 ARM repeat-containing protein [Gloeophyllum trabeum ATCC 11539]